MSRLVVISNRVDASNRESGGAQGGLAVALQAALRENGGLWFGWSGETVENFTGAIARTSVDGFTVATVDLEEQDVEEYYNGYANRTLWPLFHFRVNIAEFERDFEGGYARVNARLADTVAPLVRPDDLVWIHDYHLFPLGRELRARGLRNRIGFFLHIPWPPAELLQSMPNHRALVRALFDYDLVGFQTEVWRNNFHRYAVEQFGGEVSEEGAVSAGGRTVRTIACPIGIDAENFARLVASDTARHIEERMQRSLGGRDMIVGVDRLDYSKGLEDRFAGYERYLRLNPGRHGEVFLLQIAPPSRENVAAYQEIRARLDALSGRINGEFADFDWVPLRYVNRGYARDELAGIYRAARVGLLTPLRDGMNLVAKEYVAAQDPRDPGVLVLSKFAGAAEQLRAAVLVNPHSPEELADAIGLALAMPLGERVRRWEILMDNIRREDVMWWLRRFVGALGADCMSEEAIQVPIGRA